MTTRTIRQAPHNDDSERVARRPERQRHEACTQPRRPFDNAELRRVPRPRDDDPPYRPWWVIGPNASDDVR
jgi:hypothetical protein